MQLDRYLNLNKVNHQGQVQCLTTMTRPQSAIT